MSNQRPVLSGHRQEWKGVADTPAEEVARSAYRVDVHVKFPIAITVAVIGSALVGLWLISMPGWTAPRPAPADPLGAPCCAGAPEQDPAALAQQRQVLWRTRIEPALAAAERQTAGAIEEAARAVRQFLEQRRAGSRPFAEAALSWGSKWALIKSKAPAFLGGDAQAQVRYLNDQFTRLVFSDEQLRAAVASAAAGYLAAVQAAENELLVRVRADMADLPMEALPAIRSEAMFRDAFDRAVRQVAPQVARELGMDALREVSSFVAGEIATTVLVALATRMGVSGGLLTVGVGTSWATLGLSLVAAIVVDQVLCRVLDAVRDPVGELEGRINSLLDHLGRLIVEGDEQVVGLRARLTAFDQARRMVRRKALHALVFGADPEAVVAAGTD